MNHIVSLALQGASLKRPVYTSDYPMVPRCMAFIDMSSFTSFAHDHGSHAAASKVATFRDIIRTTTGKHGIRVAHWLGDGALLVGLNAPDVIAALCDIAKQCRKHHIPIHCGVANGEVIIFEGDDYLGRTLNIASRLANLADSMVALCYNIAEADLPQTCHYTTLHDISIRGADALPSVTKIKFR